MNSINPYISNFGHYLNFTCFHTGAWVSESMYFIALLFELKCSHHNHLHQCNALRLNSCDSKIWLNESLALASHRPLRSVSRAHFGDSINSIGINWITFFPKSSLFVFTNFDHIFSSCAVWTRTIQLIYSQKFQKPPSQNWNKTDYLVCI